MRVTSTVCWEASCWHESLMKPSSADDALQYTQPHDHIHDSARADAHLFLDNEVPSPSDQLRVTCIYWPTTCYDAQWTLTHFGNLWLVLTVIVFRITKRNFVRTHIERHMFTTLSFVCTVFSVSPSLILLLDDRNRIFIVHKALCPPLLCCFATYCGTEAVNSTNVTTCSRFHVFSQQQCTVYS